MTNKNIPHPSLEELLEYAFGEKEMVGAGDVRRHLENCSICSTELKALMDVDQQLIGAGELHRMIRYQGDILSEVAFRSGIPRRNKQRKRLALLTALPVAAAIAAFFLLSGRVWQRNTSTSRSMPGLSTIRNPSRYSPDSWTPGSFSGNMPSGSSISLASFSLPDAPRFAPAPPDKNPQKGEVS